MFPSKLKKYKAEVHPQFRWLKGMLFNFGRKKDSLDEILAALGIKRSHQSYHDARTALEKYGDIAKRMLAGVSGKDRKIDRWPSLILETLDKYGAVKVEEVLNSGHPTEVISIDTVCEKWDQIKPLLKLGGETVRYELRFYGQVQGVGFRDTFFLEGFPFGRPHFAKNLTDGTVEAAITTKKPLLDAFLGHLRDEFYIDNIVIKKVAQQKHY